ADAIAVGGFGDGSCGFKPRLRRGGSSAPCFIATAAYGAPMAEEVCVLRDFRDRYLLTNRAGAACVRAYYRFSPSVARFIARHEPVRKVVRTALSPIIVLARFGLGWRTAAMPLSIVVLCVSVFAVRRLTVRKRASC
ncbi:MAG: hypothetical protein KAJ01_08855, partial [Candidatus Hydrogenedentes bacterium]|nr:hypothetical protein [Candidatus Hydrogenedentota bacterium]